MAAIQFQIDSARPMRGERGKSRFSQTPYVDVEYEDITDEPKKQTGGDRKPTAISAIKRIFPPFLTASFFPYSQQREKRDGY